MIPLYELGIIVGVVMRTVIPYARLKTKEGFKGRFLATAILSFLVASIPLLYGEAAAALEGAPIGADFIGGFMFAIAANDGLNKLVSG